MRWCVLPGLNITLKAISLLLDKWPEICITYWTINEQVVFGGDSTVVEHSPHHAKVQGSNAAATADSENGKNVDCLQL